MQINYYEYIGNVYTIMPPKARLQFRESYTRYAQGRKEIKWRPGQEASLAPHVRIWGLSVSNVLYWIKYLCNFGTFLLPPQSCEAPIVIRRPGNYALLATLVTPLGMASVLARVMFENCLLWTPTTTEVLSSKPTLFSSWLRKYNTTEKSTVKWKLRFAESRQ